MLKLLHRDSDSDKMEMNTNPSPTASVLLLLANLLAMSLVWLEEANLCLEQLSNIPLVRHVPACMLHSHRLQSAVTQ